MHFSSIVHGRFYSLGLCRLCASLNEAVLQKNAQDKARNCGVLRFAERSPRWKTMCEADTTLSAASCVWSASVPGSVMMYSGRKDIRRTSCSGIYILEPLLSGLIGHRASHSSSSLALRGTLSSNLNSVSTRFVRKSEDNHPGKTCLC